MNDDTEIDVKDLAGTGDGDWWAPGKKVIAYLQDIVPGTGKWGRIPQVGTIVSRDKDHAWVAAPRHGHALVYLKHLEPCREGVVNEALDPDDDEDLDVKDLSGSKAGTDYVGRKEWADHHLYYDQDAKMYWIPGSSYRKSQQGTISHANHVTLLRMFPWLEEGGNEEDWGLYISLPTLEWMPLWNPFRAACDKADNSFAIDPVDLEEVNALGIKQVWKSGYSKEAFDLLAERFGAEFKSSTWATDLERFLLSDRGLAWFTSEAHESEEYWDTSGSTPPSISPERVVPQIKFDDLVKFVYPQQPEPELPLGDEQPPPDPTQLDMFEAAGDEDEIRDFMRDVNRADPDQVRVFLDERFTYDEVNDMWDMGGFCNFGGSLVDRANAEYFAETYPNVVNTVYGDMGSETVGIKVEDLDKLDAITLDGIYHDLITLSEHGVLSDEIYSRVESEQRDKAWEDWIGREVRDTLMKHFPQYEAAIYQLSQEDDPRFRAMFEDARERSGQEWIESQDTGGSQYIHVGAVLAAIDEATLLEWLSPEGIQESMLPVVEGKHEYSVVMAPAPPELADAVIRWGTMFITEDKLYLDPQQADSYGREKEVHVTVKFGLHEPEPSEELLRIIEETQPFEIDIGPATLFENEKFDVVKFDVDGEALRALNARVSQLKNSDSHPEYHAHMTVAYVQKGTCLDLVNKPLFDSNEPGAVRFLVKSVVFRGKSREKIRLFLGKPNIEPEPDVFRT